MPVPIQPKIYHIVHVDRLASIVADGFLWSEATVAQRGSAGTTIGMNNIKARRLNELRLRCHPDLHVGHCTPFYFCPRSVMLYLIYRRSEDLVYKGGQEPIIHLEADLYGTIEWAERNHVRWAFTSSNAGAYYFEDYADIASLRKINWDAVRAGQWAGAGVSRSVKEGKQAEFLVERAFPWELVERIGVHSRPTVPLVSKALGGAPHRPALEIRRDWYY
jgi:hypothetical protein